MWLCLRLWLASQFEAAPALMKAISMEDWVDEVLHDSFWGDALYKSAWEMRLEGATDLPEDRD